MRNKQLTLTAFRKKLFLLNFFIYVFCGTLQSSLLTYVIDMTMLYTICKISILIFTVTIIFQTHFKKNELIALITMIMIGLIIYWRSNSQIIFLIVLIGYAAKGVDFNKILKANLFAIVCGMAIVAYLDNVGYMPEVLFYRAGNVPRYMFGFAHPNTFSLYVCALNFCYYLLRRKELKIFDLWMIIVSIYIIANYPHSNTYMVLLILYLIYLIFKLFRLPMYEWAVKHRKILRNIIIVGSVIAVCIILYISANYERLSSIVLSNGTFVQRFAYSYKALKDYGVSLFGQSIEMYGSSYFVFNSGTTHSYFVVDCLYILLLVREGIFGFCVFFVMAYKSFKRMVDFREIELMVIFALMLICSFVETGFTNSALFFLFTYDFINAAKENEYNRSRFKFRSKWKIATRV